jgi:chemotaxis protein methyltransferase CheR
MSGRGARGDADESGAAGGSLDTVLSFVTGEMAFDPGPYNDAYLDRRVTARIRRTDAETYRDYRGLLEADEAERTALLDALNINVTRFFRNPDVWEVLRDALAALTANNRTVRCWSAPCADGREPYSLAMLARDDPAIDASRMDIVGTDIDGEALAAARRGAYETTRTTDIAEELAPLSDLDAHVDRDGDSFTVRRPVREMVEFRRHDLLRDDPLGEFELVLCRNLLIYIDGDHTRDIFDGLAAAVVPDGYLTIGKSETLPREFRDSFDAVERGAHVYRHR